MIKAIKRSNTTACHLYFLGKLKCTVLFMEMSDGTFKVFGGKDHFSLLVENEQAALSIVNRYFQWMESSDGYHKLQNINLSVRLLSIVTKETKKSVDNFGDAILEVARLNHEMRLERYRWFYNLFNGK